MSAPSPSADRPSTGAAPGDSERGQAVGPGLAPDESWLRLAGLSLLGCIPLLGLLVLPLIVGGWVDELGYSERDAGLLASANFLGAALAALVLAFRMHRLDLRRVTVLGLLGMALADGLSVLSGEMPALLIAALRFLSGVASAGVFGAVMGAIAGFRSPDRGYGAFMAMQFFVSGVGLYLLSPLMPGLGVTGIFLMFSVTSLLGLTLVNTVPGKRARDRLNLPRPESGPVPASKSEPKPEPEPESASAPAPVTVEWKIIVAPAALLTLLAYGLFESAQMGQFAYIERIGVSLGFSGEQLGLSLGFASFIGIPGAMAVTLLGSRFGYFRPIMVAALIQILVMGWLLRASAFEAYFVIASVFSFFWAFVLPYFQAACARIDPRGSVVVAAGFATGTAGFLGPAVAAFLVRPDDYGLMIAGVIATLSAVILLCVFVSRTRGMDNRVEV